MKISNTKMSPHLTYVLIHMSLKYLTWTAISLLTQQYLFEKRRVTNLSHY